MRLVVASVTGALGLLLLGGPVFWAVARLLGGDVVVAGGAVRLIFDLVVGGLLVRAATVASSGKVQVPTRRLTNAAGNRAH